MTSSIIHHNKNGHYAATVEQHTTINALPKVVWGHIGNVVGLTEWVVDVKKTEFLSKIRRGVGAIRKIAFLDGSQVIEYVVGWNPEHHLSYVATSGLPLDVYHATLSLSPKGKSTLLSWSSFLISNSPDKKQFEEFLSFIDGFYEKSLQNLKKRIEQT